MLYAMMICSIWNGFRFLMNFSPLRITYKYVPISSSIDVGLDMNGK